MPFDEHGNWFPPGGKWAGEEEKPSSPVTSDLLDLGMGPIKAPEPQTPSFNLFTDLQSILPATRTQTDTQVLPSAQTQPGPTPSEILSLGQGPLDPAKIPQPGTTLPSLSEMLSGAQQTIQSMPRTPQQSAQPTEPTDDRSWLEKARDSIQAGLDIFNVGASEASGTKWLAENLARGSDAFYRMLGLSTGIPDNVTFEDMIGFDRERAEKEVGKTAAEVLDIGGRATGLAASAAPTMAGSVTSGLARLFPALRPALTTLQTAPGALRATAPAVSRTAVDQLASLGARAALIGAGQEYARGATTPDMQDRSLVAQFGASMTAGQGDVIEGVGQALKWMGFENLGNDIAQYGQRTRQGFEIPTEEFSWKSLLDPRFYAVSVGRALPFTIGMLPLALGGGAAGGAAAGAIGMGALGRTIMQAIGASLFSTPFEAAIEAGGVYEEARQRGMSEEEADRAANRTFLLNAALLGFTNAAEFATAFMPRGVMNRLSRAGLDTTGARIAGTALQEGAQEVAQEAVSSTSLGDPFSLADPSVQEQFAIGALMGGGFGALGTSRTAIEEQAIGTLYNNVKAKLPANAQNELDRMVQQGMIEGKNETEAMTEVLEVMAQQPEGEQIITQAVQEEIARFDVQQEVVAQEEMASQQQAQKFPVTPSDDVQTETATEQEEIVTSEITAPETAFEHVQEPEAETQVTEEPEPVETTEEISESVEESEAVETEPTVAEESTVTETSEEISEPAPTEATTEPEGDLYQRMSDFNRKMREGDYTAQDIRDQYEFLTNNKDAIIASILERINNDPRHKRRRKDTKQRMAENTYRQSLERLAYADSDIFAIQGASIFDSSDAAFERSLREKIASITDESIQAHLAKKREEQEARRKAIEQPETIEELEEKLRITGELTSEEQARLDDLVARRQREQKEEAKSPQTVSVGDFDIREGKHTKTGETLFIVNPKERLSKEDFSALRNQMKELGAYWSNFKPNVGFIFKYDPTEQLQQLFGGEAEAVVSGQEETARKSRADKLREVADNMQSAIDEKRADRLTNTARRARMAANAQEDADRMERIQKIMRNLADAIERGESVHLDGVSARTHVEELQHIVSRRVYEVMRESGERTLDRNGNHVRREPRPSDVDGMEYPKPMVFHSRLMDLIKGLAGVSGTGRAAQRVHLAVIRQRRGDEPANMIDVSGVWDDLTLLLSKAKGTKAEYAAKAVNEDLALYKRLQAMGLETPEQFRAALREFIQYSEGTGVSEEERKRREIRQREQELARQNIEGFFPTPPEIVEQMLDLAEIEQGMRVLEPSAGKGDIADAILETQPNASLDTVEYNNSLAQLLEEKGHRVVGSDFMEYQPEELYDRIVMNPPFERGQDIDHVRHAYELLKPGGRIVAIMSEGPFFRKDKKAQSFREWLEEVEGTSEKLPEGSFKSSDRPTGVNTRIVVIDKAEAAEETKPAEIEVTGRETTVRTERGTAVNVQYAVVSADDLITSHDTSLRVNRDFPAELQPRDRGRAASEDQINRIVGRLEPSFLGESPKASEGAPIIGNDMVVESGNGRAIALKRSYDNNTERVQNYRQWLMENADTFGLSVSDIEQVERPVLVRVRTTDMTMDERKKFVQEANEQSVASMSATEQARVDAKKLTGAVMTFFNPGDDANILAASNREFVRLFMQEIVGPNERSRYMDKHGELNQEGVTRIRNAVFAKAYGDTSAIEKLAESTDNNVRNITNGMLIAAPRIAQMKEGIEQGIYYDLDMTPDIAAAMNKLSDLRNNGETVEYYLNQGDLFGDELSAEAKDWLGFFDANKRSGKRIAAVLNAYVDMVEAAGDPNQLGLFETQTPTKSEVLESALRKVEQRGDEGQIALWDDPGERREGTPETRRATAEDERTQPDRRGRQEEVSSQTEFAMSARRTRSPRRKSVNEGETIIDVDSVNGLSPEVTKKISDMIASQLGTTIRDLTSKLGAEGTFSQYTGVGAVRKRSYDDWRVIGHELGHAFSFTYGGPVGVNEELLRLANQTYPGKIPKGHEFEEGFAEFFYIWVADPDKARRWAPRTTELFEDFVTGNKDLSELFVKVRTIVDNHLDGTPLERGLGAITTSIDPNNNEVRGGEYEVPWHNRFVFNHVDSTLPAGDMMKDLSLKPKGMVNFRQYMSVVGDAKEKAVIDFTHQARDHEGRFIEGRALKTIMEEAVNIIGREMDWKKIKVASINKKLGALEIFSLITLSNRVIERYERGFENLPLTKDEAEAILEQARDMFPSEVFDLAEEYSITLSNLILEKLERADMLTKEARKQIEAGSSYYYPFYYDKRGFFTPSGRSQQGKTYRSPVKRFTGRRSAVLNIFQATMHKLAEVEQAIEYKRAIDTIHTILEQKGMGKYGVIIPAPPKSIRVDMKQIIDQIGDLLNDEVDIEEILAEDRAVRVFMPGGFDTVGRHERVIMNVRNGKPTYMRLAPDVFDMLISMKPVQIEGAAKFLAWASRITRYTFLATLGYMKNVMTRDLAAAMIQSGNNPFVLLRHYHKGLSATLGLNDEVYATYVSSGGFSGVAENVLKSMTRTEYDEGILKMGSSGWGTVQMKGKKVFARIVRTPSEALRVLEEYKRIAEFIATWKRNAKELGFDGDEMWERYLKEGTDALPQELQEEMQRILIDAAHSSREIEANYGLGGVKEWSRKYMPTVTFLKGSVQGIYRSLRLVKNNPRRAFLGVGSLGMISILSWVLMNMDDDDKRQLADMDSSARDRYWWFPIGDTGMYYAIAKPYEYALPANFLERYLDYLWADVPHARKPLEEWHKAVSESFGIPFIPQMFKVWMDLQSNTSDFGGSIVSMSDQRLAKDMQFGPNTSETAKGLASAINAAARFFSGAVDDPTKGVSAKQVEYFIKGLTGQYGSGVMKGIDWITGLATGKKVKSIAGVEYAPFVGNLLYGQAEGSSRIVNKFYDDYNLAQTLSTSTNKLMQDGATKKPAFATEKNVTLIRYLPAMRAIANELSEMRKEYDILKAEADPKQRRRLQLQQDYIQKLATGLLYGVEPRSPHPDSGITDAQIQMLVDHFTSAAQQALVRERKSKGGATEQAIYLLQLMERN